uniref:Dymeclin n=1 Tax=Phallusia mammillata TaxID=59560 RepID=A0A6F9DAS5_9ASCI|nr:dymeclin-like [Phallusia mammillata]
MGIGCSSISQLRENEYLTKLSSKQTISENEPFWNQLFSFQLASPASRSEQIALEEVTETFCKLLVDHNQHTGNFTSLIKVFLSRSSELKSSAECDDKLFIWQSCNALFIIRHLCKFLAENMTEEKMTDQFEARSLVDRKNDLTSGSIFEGSSAVNYMEPLIVSLVDVLIHVPILESTYPLHMESLNILLVLLSVQMFVPSPTQSGQLHKCFVSELCVQRGNMLMRALVQNFVEQRPVPNTNTNNEGGSLVLGLASAVASSVFSVINFRTDSGDAIKSVDMTKPTLGHQSALLILALTNHNFKDQTNPYKSALFNFRHIQGRQSSSNSSDSLPSPSFHINFSRLYSTLCTTQLFEAGTLLLYALLHGNQDVRTYILSKTDIDTLVIPILKILYSAPAQNSHHIYMALIVLLILTEDDNFNKSVHEIKLSSVAWYTDRILTNVSLGDLVILVVVRTIQFNMCQMRDRYLHTNCLAALANMSAHFREINVYAAQRIFSLIMLLSKKHKRALEKVVNSAYPSTSNHTSDATVVNMDSDKDYASDLSILEEVIRMLLEIVNSCLTEGALRHNVNLVYALLHKRDAFEQLRQNPCFQDVLQNIDTIIGFFTERLNKFEKQTMTIEEVHEVIKDATVQLPSHQLHKFPELKFRYVEEDCPEEFFVPYIWSLIFNKSGLFWNPGCVQLFALE